MNKKNALISVYNKEGIEKFAKDLVDLGWEIISSGGTARYLAGYGIKVKDVSELVGGEAILGHRVVTLSREVHAGLMARPEVAQDLAELEKLNIPFIDLVCVDLYPLEDAIAKPDASYESVIESTDVGGPTLIRSATKGGRIVICDPSDREKVIEKLKNKGDIAKEERIELAAKSEYVISKYCLESAKFHSQEKYDGLVGEQVAETLYGENAYQVPGKLYSTENNDPLVLDKFKVLTDMAPSFNNTCDIDRMLQTLTHIVAVFEINNISAKYFGVAVKHGNCCGAAYGNDKIEVIKKIAEGDPRAIFGGLAMFNFNFDKDEAETLLTHLMDEGQRRLLDGIVTAGFSEKALELSRRKKDKCRFVVNSALADINKDSLDNKKRFRYVRRGFLTQPNYTFVLDFSHPEIEIQGVLEDAKKADLLLAWAISATSNSNTITLVNNSKLVGNGVGQQDRVGCCELAIKRAKDAGHEIEGAVTASDSFFPFPDAPQVLIDAGVKTIFSTSGSVNDSEIQKLCVDSDVALVQIPDKLARGFFGH
jgi:phosphoribosylaminoimidazolecarboxamide formyltransferase / IMP cyclohydrolase